jgi:restriction system protein
MRKRKPSKRQQQAVVNLAAAGLMLIVLPFAFTQEPMHSALAKLPILGVVLLVAAGGVAWIQWRQAQGAGQRQGGGPLPKISAEPSKPKQSSPVPVAQPTIEAGVVAASSEMPVRAPVDLWGPEVFKAFEWRRCEAVVEALFAQAGFETKSQSHGADGGVDIWLYSKNQPG